MHSEREKSVFQAIYDGELIPSLEVDDDSFRTLGSYAVFLGRTEWVKFFLSKMVNGEVALDKDHYTLWFYLSIQYQELDCFWELLSSLQEKMKMSGGFSDILAKAYCFAIVSKNEEFITILDQVAEQRESHHVDFRLRLSQKLLALHNSEYNPITKRWALTAMQSLASGDDHGDHDVPKKTLQMFVDMLTSIQNFNLRINIDKSNRGLAATQKKNEGGPLIKWMSILPYGMNTRLVNILRSEGVPHSVARDLSIPPFIKNWAQVESYNNEYFFPHEVKWFTGSLISLFYGWCLYNSSKPAVSFAGFAVVAVSSGSLAQAGHVCISPYEEFESYHERAADSPADLGDVSSHLARNLGRGAAHCVNYISGLGR